MTEPIDELTALKRRAHDGQVSPAELPAIAERLQATTDPLEQDDLIQTLKYVPGAWVYAPLVAPALASHTPHLVAAAIYTLCNTWRLTDRYAAQLLVLMHGPPWDRDGWAQVAAFDAAGLWLSRAPDEHRPVEPLLLQGIIDMAEDPEAEAIMVYKARHYLYQILRDPSLTDETVIPAAKARLAAEEARVAATGHASPE